MSTRNNNGDAEWTECTSHYMPGDMVKFINRILGVDNLGHQVSEGRAMKYERDHRISAS